MADWVGTIVGLWDVAVRVATFANDLRSAQDDFVGLRAEAECLLICINSLNSPSCQDTLYRYINDEQAADLDAIVKNTELNMVDLNKFIAKCWRLVERDVGKNVRKKGWKGMGTRLKEKVAKAWARYRFTMTDKQAFRNKLILPTQSVNIYLTTLTHVGLVNVKFLIEPSGGGGGGGAYGGGSGGGGGKDGPLGGTRGGQTGGGQLVRLNPMKGWEAVGRRVAFRDSIVRKSELTTDIEDEIVMYALHLMRGGAPFHANNNTGGPTYRVTKTAKARTRSRSRSAGPVGLGRRRRSGMYLVRKKSVSKPASERIEIVEKEYRSGSDSEGQAGRRLLALPAPDSSPGVQYVDIRPPYDSSSSSSSNNDSGLGGHGGPSRSPSPPPHPPPFPPFHAAPAGPFPEPDSVDRQRRSSHEHARRPHISASGRPNWHGTSRDELKDRRRNVQDLIQAEADAAVSELEAKQNASRVDRRHSRAQMRHRNHNFTHEEEEAEDKEDDMYELCDMLMEEYGVYVEPLPEGFREPIYGPKVKAAPPTAEREAEHKTAHGHESMYHSEKSRHVMDSSEDEASEKADEELVKSMSHGRSDRLKAETSMMGSAASFSRSGYGYGGPRRTDRSGHTNLDRSMRFAPYPMHPSPPDIYRHRPRYGTRPYDDESHGRPGESYNDNKINIIEVPPHDARYRHGRSPRYRSDHKDSDDDSYESLGPPMPKPRGPGPRPGGHDERLFRELAKDEKESMGVKRREKKRPEKMEVKLHQPSPGRPVSHLQHPPRHHKEARETLYESDLQRRGSHAELHVVSPVFHQPGPSSRRHHQPSIVPLQPVDREVYMSGARHADDELSRRYGSVEPHDDDDDEEGSGDGSQIVVLK